MREIIIHYNEKNDEAYRLGLLDTDYPYSLCLTLPNSMIITLNGGLLRKQEKFYKPFLSVDEIGIKWEVEDEKYKHELKTGDIVLLPLDPLDDTDMSGGGVGIVIGEEIVEIDTGYFHVHTFNKIATEIMIRIDKITFEVVI